jgi:hypothetical protein
MGREVVVAITNGKLGGVNLPFVFVTDDGGVLDRIKEMRGIVLRSDKDARGFSLQRLAEESGQRVRNRRVSAVPINGSNYCLSFFKPL